MTVIPLTTDDGWDRLADAVYADDDPTWRYGALCAQTDPEVFFPDFDDSGTTAKRVCQRCPVAATCLQYALDNNELHGVWGGLTARERLALDQKAS